MPLVAMTPPGDPDERPEHDLGDLEGRLRRRRELLVRASTKDFALPGYEDEGIVVRYRRQPVDTYRQALAASALEWEKYAQLLQDACDGFFVALDDGGLEPILDEMGEPLAWWSLAKLLGVEAREGETRAVDLVLQVFGGEAHEMVLVGHGQDVDVWMSNAADVDDEELAEK